jgi:ADP-heptose:LPS heptosyltransferase
MPKFLIIRFSSIGDIVLTTPVIRCLKIQMPEAEIHYLTKASFASILQPNPYIDQLHLHDQDLKATIQKLKREKFDFVIDLHNNVRTLKVKIALGVKSFSFEKLNIEKWAMTALKINRLPDIHIVDRYLKTLSSWGIENDGAGLDYFIPADAGLKPDTIPESHRNGYLGIVIGAALATKKLPVESIRTLCSFIKYPIILLGGNEDANDGEGIAKNLPHVFNACGKCSLHQSADLVRQSKFIITHDTGLMHIAAAFQKPIISIWGNTIPEFGMGPYYKAGKGILSVIFEIKDLKCRPCSKIGYRQCPKGHFKCMNLHDLVVINAAVTNFWTVL